ncbi:hypothetical protein [Sphingomonas hankookensis]|uniref:hypothetical protein n=1 Tax=Sphingomonas hankookensis TaxID=563996 RepID=UPI00234E8260|nr:hypothetical protein [Sphingomonas hankookensis]WCP71986.1 hypothetical protein PPZ50_16875 [Sphingomonas hankookensis]
MTRGAAFVCTLLPLLTACQPDPPNDPARLAVFDTAPPPPAPPVDPRSLTAMSPADIRRVAMACLQPPPYMPDGGPMCLRADGSWIVYSGWGDPQGSYTIVGNEVRIEGRVVGDVQRLAFYRSADGHIYMREAEPPEGPAFLFEPYSEADFLNGR